MEMVRGDTFEFKFKRQTRDGRTITSKPEKMYITFKCDDNYKCLFQKTLEKGITFDGEYYHVVIDPADTYKLSFKKYDFDIEIINNGKTKTIYVGEIELLKEVTFKCNEV